MKFLAIPSDYFLRLAEKRLAQTASREGFPGVEETPSRIQAIRLSADAKFGQACTGVQEQKIACTNGQEGRAAHRMLADSPRTPHPVANSRGSACYSALQTVLVPSTPDNYVLATR